jgi:3-oxoacyl-[acyl-carrier-protein] synthase-1
VFTGAGAVCGAGLSVDEIWTALITGRSAVGPIRRWNAEHWPVTIAAEVTGVSNRTLVEDRKSHKYLSRTDLFGLYAAGMALEQSGLLPHRNTLSPEETVRFNDRTGVFAGSGGGNYGCNYDFFPLLTEAGGTLQRFGQELDNTVNPLWLLRNLPNNVVCHIGIRYNFKGTNACVTNQCLGGISAVAEAAYALRRDEADRGVAAGHDAPIDIETIVNFERVGLLSREAIRPFDSRRDGTVLGEGAAACVLEKLPEARDRGATVLGEFLGFGCTAEATGILDVRADGEGVAQAIQLALNDAGVGPDAIGMVVTHANGTPKSDASEAQALKTVFGDRIPPVTGFKWATGHTIAACGVLDLLLALRALQENEIPGIPTLETVDPVLAPLPVSATVQQPANPMALVICRAFGGMTAAMVIGAAPADFPA